ncbi:MAG: SAM-dependent methyltransferase [Gammaproteobacteria bacterium]
MSNIRLSLIGEAFDPFSIIRSELQKNKFITYNELSHGSFIQSVDDLLKIEAIGTFAAIEYCRQALQTTRINELLRVSGNERIIDRILKTNVIARLRHDVLAGNMEYFNSFSSLGIIFGIINSASKRYVYECVLRHQLIKNLEDLKYLLVKYPYIVPALLQNPTVSSCIKTFDEAYYLVTHFPKLELQSLSIMMSKIENKQQLIKMAAINLNLVETLLKNARLRMMAEGIPDFYQKIALENLIYNEHLASSVVPETRSANLAYLDLTTSKSLEHKHKKEKPIEHEPRNLATKQITRIFPTLKSYVDNMMFGPSGYYETGSVKFLNHFTTFATGPAVAEGFAAAFAEQLFHRWKKQIEGDASLRDKPFNVLECGAGNGLLCKNILSVIKKMSEMGPKETIEDWKCLYKNIRYHIIERSTELVIQQKKTVLGENYTKNPDKDFADKVVFLQKDARKLREAFTELEQEQKKEIRMSMVISNELLDVLPPQKLVRASNGSINVGLVTPAISHRFLEEFARENKLVINIDKLLIKSKQYKALLNLHNPDATIPFPDDHILLSAKDFLKLHQLVATKPKYNDVKVFSFGEIDVPSTYFPEVMDFIKRHPNFVSSMQVGDKRYANVGVRDYLQNVTQVLMPGGEVISVDYGNNDMQINNYLRTYLNNLVEMDDAIFLQPGKRDITYDVNFTTVAEDGKILGLQPIFFGNQSQMLAHRADFEKAGVPAEKISNFLNKQNDFRFILQSYTGKPLEEKMQQTSGRFFGESSPVTRGQLFGIQKSLISETGKQKHSPKKPNNSMR